MRQSMSVLSAKQKKKKQVHEKLQDIAKIPFQLFNKFAFRGNDRKEGCSRHENGKKKRIEKIKAKLRAAIVYRMNDVEVPQYKKSNPLNFDLNSVNGLSSYVHFLRDDEFYVNLPDKCLFTLTNEARDWELESSIVKKCIIGTPTTPSLTREIVGDNEQERYRILNFFDPKSIMVNVKIVPSLPSP